MTTTLSLEADPNFPLPPSSPSRFATCYRKRRPSNDDASTKTSRIASPLKKQKNEKSALLPPQPSVCTKNAGQDEDIQNVKVVARVRPLSTKERNENSSEAIKCSVSSSCLTIERNRTFEYDAVFEPAATQARVYEGTVGDMVRRNIPKGFNTTILAYGQTGSGKTFTMGTECGGDSLHRESDERDDGKDKNLTPPADGEGIIPRAVYDLFATKRDIAGNTDVKVELSYLEIYNEEIRDLLARGVDGKESSTDCHIRDRPDGSVAVTGLTSIEVHSPVQVYRLMEEAAHRRATASTHMNAVSSRSHAICTLSVTISPTSQSEGMTNENGNSEKEESLVSGEQVCAKLTLVDLAGSERIKRTGAEGARMKEGININKGLFVLGQVVSSLSEMGQQQEQASQPHIPYRDSKLTRLLQDSLGGNSRTVMVACVSPADTNTEESLNTLRYAQRTRNIKNSAVRNVVAAPLSAAEVAALRRENQMLKLQLAQEKAKSNGFAPGQTIHMALPSNLTSSPEAQCLHGLNVEKLEIVTKLRANCTSLQTKIEQLEDQLQSSVEDALTASLRSDRWQLKHEQVVATAKAAGVQLSESHNSKENESILSHQRQQLSELRNQLQDARADAAVARATAAAVVAGGGDLDSVAALALGNEGCGPGTEVLEDDSDTGHDQLTSQLVAMSGEIEQKEEMAKKMNEQRECMEQMHSHFEAAMISLQEEVHTLTTEKNTLLSQLEKRKKQSPKAGQVPSHEICPERRKMQERISDLEKRIKELNRKASEHARAIRMREQAEKKCSQLASEISADKKRRAALQRKLKEEAEERRSEKKAARLQASKMLRDSQKLQYELNKVKDAAAKQAAVLRRKIDTMTKQKAVEEKRKRQLNAARSGRVHGMNSGQMKPNRMDPKSTFNKDELEKWLDQEIESAILLRETKSQIEVQTILLKEAFKVKEEALSTIDGENASVQVSGELRSIQNEIDSRTKVLQQLERNLSEIQRAANKLSSSGDNSNIPPAKTASMFVDAARWQSLSKSDLRILCTSTLDRVLTFKEEVDILRSKQGEKIASAVNSALSKERRRADEFIASLKMEHAEAIMTLLESTKGAMEKKVSRAVLEAAEGGIDESVRCAVDNMLNSYFEGCSKVGAEVKEELMDVKHKQEGMRRVVDQVAVNIIAENEAAAVAPKKKQNTKKRKEINETESDFDDFELEDESGGGEHAEDSDSEWSPDTPAPKKRRSDRSEKKHLNSSRDEEREGRESHTEDSALNALKVPRLKEMLRERGLAVSGKKQDLILRLKAAMSASSDSSDDSKENRRPAVSFESNHHTPRARDESRQPLANRNPEDPNIHNHRDETIVFSAKKKRRGLRIRKTKGAMRRKNMTESLNKVLSDTEKMLEQVL